MRVATCRAKATSARRNRHTDIVHRTQQARPRVRCTSIASPMTRSINDSARSVPHPSVIPVVLRPSSVRSKNKSIRARTRGRGGHGGWLALHRGSPRYDRAGRYVFDSHGGRAEDHGDHGGRGSDGRRAVSLEGCFTRPIAPGGVLEAIVAGSGDPGRFALEVLARLRK